MMIERVPVRNNHKEQSKKQKGSVHEQRKNL